MAIFFTNLSATALVAGLIVALFTLRLAASRGFRELRYLAGVVFLASLYAGTNACAILPLDGAVQGWAARLNILFGGLHAAAWFIYAAEQEGRKIRGYEWFFVASGFIGGLLGLVPGVVIARVTTRDVTWLGLTYRDGRPTRVGEILFVIFVASFVVLTVRYTRKWLRGDALARAHAIGLGALLVGATNDTIAGAGLAELPYILDLGFLVMVTVVGLGVTRRFVDATRALDRHSSALRAAQAELVQKERLAAIGELSAVVAHEVRNPLGVILNALAALKRTTPQEGEAREVVRIVEEEALRLRRIIGELLEFARPRATRLADANFVETVRSAAHAVTQSTAVPPETVVVESDVDALTMTCDADLLRQAVINLVHNALAAPRRKGPVRLVIGSEDGTAVLSVVDDGEGVAEDLAERIFVPFFTTRSSGTGLGLPLVQRIAEAHGGGITVEPTPGGGATFVLRLPLRPGD